MKIDIFEIWWVSKKCKKKTDRKFFITRKNIFRKTFSKLFCFRKLHAHSYPISYRTLQLVYNGGIGRYKRLKIHQICQTFQVLQATTHIGITYLTNIRFFWFTPDFGELVLHDHSTVFKKFGIVFEALAEICRFRGVSGPKTKCKVFEHPDEYPDFSDFDIIHPITLGTQ